MEKERKLVAEIMLKEIEKIGEIKRQGIMIECNEKAIAEYLNIKETEKDDLILLRNLLVERLADRIEEIRDVIEFVKGGYGEEAQKKSYDRIDEQHAIMTVVTGIIDKEFYLR